MLNQDALSLVRRALADAAPIRCARHTVTSAQVLDCGVDQPGSLDAGLVLARLCLGDAAHVSFAPADSDRVVSDNAVCVRTDRPLVACLGAQYAGWPIQNDNYFAMGSGPMRMMRGREEVLEQLALRESGEQIVGVLESDRLPDESAIRLIAEQCGVVPQDVHLAIASSTSLAGSVQVVARSVETAMHKLHALEFDVASVISATGTAPLPPPAKPGEMVNGIGRTNDAMLYGARVTLWADTADEAIDAVADRVPSNSSADHGQPFAEIFKQYDYDFYRVDPLLFSPAVVTIHNLRSGRTWTRGRIEPDVLRQSFFS